MPPKRSRSATPPLVINRDEDTSTSTLTGSAPISKKLKLLQSYADTSPFPDYLHPTPAEARAVHNLLSTFHNRVPHRPPVRSIVQDGNSAGTCDQGPNVIDSLIGTILSQNTSAANSDAAKASLNAAFPADCASNASEGSPIDFAALASAPRSTLVEAIKRGGLANKKAAVIQNLLHDIHTQRGSYSLQHLLATSDSQAMAELVSYDGVGPKTASCVLLFCLQRDSFAVDTHVFRLSKLLGWVPAKADRVFTQAHLDLRVPDKLKYGLHALMIMHGRQCTGCKAKSSGSCPLKTYIKEKATHDVRNTKVNRDI